MADAAKCALANQRFFYLTQKVYDIQDSIASLSLLLGKNFSGEGGLTEPRSQKGRFF
jgi:hypothetical protein